MQVEICCKASRRRLTEEEDNLEDTFIYQLWVHEGHEYSHI